MKHYQCEQYNALDAISQAQRIAFAPCCFQASWCLRETGVLAYLESRGKTGATTADIASHCGLSEYAVAVLLDMGLGGGVCHLAGEHYVLGKVGKVPAKRPHDPGQHGLHPARLLPAAGPAAGCHSRGQAGGAQGVQPRLGDHLPPSG